MKRRREGERTYSSCQLFRETTVFNNLPSESSSWHVLKHYGNCRSIMIIAIHSNDVLMSMRSDKSKQMSLPSKEKLNKITHLISDCLSISSNISSSFILASVAFFKLLTLYITPGESLLVAALTTPNLWVALGALNLNEDASKILHWGGAGALDRVGGKGDTKVLVLMTVLIE